LNERLEQEVHRAVLVTGMFGNSHASGVVWRFHIIRRHS
jgi:hypothetical protein